MGWVLISVDRRAVNISGVLGDLNTDVVILRAWMAGHPELPGDSACPTLALVFCARKTIFFLCGRKTADKKPFDAFENLGGRMRRVHNSTKFAAVSHAMSKPARELLHFAYTIGQVGSINLPIVVHE
jgi:hypothetical protein